MAGRPALTAAEHGASRCSAVYGSKGKARLLWDSWRTRQVQVDGIGLTLRQFMVLLLIGAGMTAAEAGHYMTLRCVNCTAKAARKLLECVRNKTGLRSGRELRLFAMDRFGDDLVALCAELNIYYGIAEFPRPVADIPDREPPDHALWLRLYESGQSKIEIAQRFGYATNTVHVALIRQREKAESTH